MRGIYIISEGQTEREFINTILAPFLATKNIYDVRPILLRTSSEAAGGDLNYARFKDNAERLLKSQGDIIVTSLIDFFRLRNDFPKYAEALQIPDRVKRVDFLEKAISDDINHTRLLPYIQLHEFEGLLFSDVRGINYLPDIPLANKTELEEIIINSKNPELINDGAETAPSKRLEKLIPKYRKPLYGAIMAEEIGIDRIMEKCPRFNNWIKSLIERMKKDR